MSVLRQVGLYCDAKGCHQSVTVTDASPKQARVVARKWGWRHDGKRGKDHCPDHGTRR